jgi:hypothetical protein
MKRSKSFTIQKKGKDQIRSKPASIEKTQRQAPAKNAESIPDAILRHISSRSDVEIIVHYEDYK